MTMTKEQTQQLLDQKMAAVNSLNRQYPGVRPSWVSGELSILWVQIENLRKQLEATE